MSQSLSHRNAGPGRWLLLLSLGLPSLSGCWEEIHYEPPASETVAQNEQRDDDEAPAADGPADAPAVDADGGPGPERAVASDEPSPDVPDAPPAVSGDDLFAAAQAPAETPLATGSTAEPSAATNDLAPGTPATAASARERLLVWQATHKWSFAAALLSKGLDPARYEPIRAEALDAAAELGLELPPLPTAIDQQQLPATVLDMLRGAPAASLIEQIGERFTPAESALAELAIQSNLLLLSYLPRLSSTAEAAAAVRRAAEGSGLESDLWQPLVALLEERAEFLEVRQAVFELQRLTDRRLQGATDAADDSLPVDATGSP